MPADSKASGTAVEIINPLGSGNVVLLCEHASSHIPERYNGLGLDDKDTKSHAAWDPGARELGLILANELDAAFVCSCVSRLVYDCNRPPSAKSAMPEKSELIEIPGNRNLSDAARTERVQTVYVPFCTKVSDVLSKRADTPVALVTIHSFTPVYFGAMRDVEIGLLHDSDSQMVDLMLADAANLPHRCIQRNAPYGPEDGVTHSLKLHGIQNGLPNVMIEVRNDLLKTPKDIRTIADELLSMLRPALNALTGREAKDA